LDTVKVNQLKAKGEIGKRMEVKTHTANLEAPEGSQTEGKKKKEEKKKKAEGPRTRTTNVQEGAVLTCPLVTRRESRSRSPCMANKT
jgi:hypothetical protein